RISISVVVRRPGWESWAFGSERRETLTVQTPAARIVNRWVRTNGAHAEVRFDTPVERVSVAGAAVSGRRVTLPTKTPAGSFLVAAAARPWEKLGVPVRVTWFPHSNRPVVLASPGPRGRANPLSPIRFTFSAPVARVLPGATPTVVPSVAGDWVTIDDH